MIPSTDHGLSRNFADLMSAMKAYEGSLRVHALRLLFHPEANESQALEEVLESVKHAREEIEPAHRALARHRPVQLSTISKPRSARTKRPASDLRAILAGQPISGTSGADVFVSTIEAIGVERVAALGLTLCGVALVSRSRVPGHYPTLTLSSGFYFCTHASNQEKKRVLDTIAQRLGLALTVSINLASQ